MLVASAFLEGFLFLPPVRHFRWQRNDLKCKPHTAGEGDLVCNHHLACRMLLTSLFSQWAHRAPSSSKGHTVCKKCADISHPSHAHFNIPCCSKATIPAISGISVLVRSGVHFWSKSLNCTHVLLCGLCHRVIWGCANLAPFRCRQTEGCPPGQPLMCPMLMLWD